MKEKKLIALGALLSFLFLTLTYGIQFGFIPNAGTSLESDILIAYGLISSISILGLVGLFLMSINKNYFDARDEIAELNKDLKQNLEVKSTLNKIMVHDFSTPLMIIKMTADKLLASDALENKPLEIIKHSCLSIISILQNVKAMIVDPKSIHDAQESLVLKDTVNELLTTLSPMLSAKGINVEVNIEATLTLVTNKAVLKSNIISNIMTNAIKFSPPSGGLKINAHQEESQVFIHILDSGPGMSEEKLKTIYSFDSNTSTKGTQGEKGTGYGIPIVKFSIGLLHGTAEVRNRIDGPSGLEFILKLPV